MLLRCVGRLVWAAIGPLHDRLWTFTLTEAGALGRPADDVVDHPDSP
jgi:hypothetical protein